MGFLNHQSAIINLFNEVGFNYAKVGGARSPWDKTRREA